MRIVFMGTPEFAVPPLRALLDAGYDVVGVITQPDRPAGRGHKLTACPVKQLAQERNVPVYQFEKIKREEGVACLKALAPDLCVTAAFGQILSKEILDIPKYGTVNVHASLLPEYRGSAPINWCIINGEKIAGATTMLTDVGMDTGDMLLRRETEIGDMETAGELTQRLSEIGAQLLIDNGSALARMLGVPDAVIAATMIAIGTSLPELVTTLTAIKKKQASLSVGNIIGANIMDLTLIMPLCAVIQGKPMTVERQGMLLDIPACLIICAAALIPALVQGKFKRWIGYLIGGLYIAYLIIIFTCFGA